MGASIAKADQRVGMTHYVVHGVERAVGVVSKRPIEDRLTAFLKQQVIGDFGGLPPFARSHGGNAALCRRLVIRWLAEREDAIPFGDATRQHLVLDRL